MAGIEVSGVNHICCKCGDAFGRKKGNFLVSYGTLYKGSGYMPYCMKCVDGLYNAYLQESQDAKNAVHQMCRKLDLYWSQSIFDSVERTNTTRSMMTSYISKTNSIRYAGKCYDDTLREGGAVWDDASIFARHNALLDLIDEDTEVAEVAPEVIAFWGVGFSPDFYAELEQKYSSWTTGLGTLDPGERAIYKQICILETTINRDSAAGKPIDKHVNALNTLLGSANLKPAQRKNDDLDAELDNMPFGVGIRKWENTRPVPEPDPEFRDVDGIIKHITVWYYGHMAKAAGLKNTYSKLYEKEIERLRVEHPEFVDEEDDELLNNVFGEFQQDGESE